MISTILAYPVTTIFVISFLVFIHELGHYLAARIVGVEVQEFSIGFPPKLISKVIGKTKYIISMIPLGGYVKLKGQNFADEDSGDPTNYSSKTGLQRFLILVAGPLMNLLGAIVIFSLGIYFIGKETPHYFKNSPIIYGIAKSSLAESLDLQIGDKITHINQVAVMSWAAVQEKIRQTKGDMIELNILRNNQTHLLIIKNLKIDWLDREGTVNQKIGWHPKTGNFIYYLNDEGAAKKAGLQERDQIISLNSTVIELWRQISIIIKKIHGGDLTVKVKRGTEILEFNLKTEQLKTRNGEEFWGIGIAPSIPTYFRRVDISDSLQHGTKRFLNLTIATFRFLGEMFQGNMSKDDIGGPIAIGKGIGDAAKATMETSGFEAEIGMATLFKIVAFISLQLGIFNLLPIPALDGGHIFFIILEKIKGSPLSIEFREKAQFIGFSLLMLLILFVTFNDGFRFFG